jgi:sec-independent protein translocase protein TatA
MDLGAPEILIILVIVLLLFGGNQLPKLARSLGQAKRELESGMRHSDEPDAKDEPAKNDPVKPKDGPESESERP